jgi:hypothetical protein
MRGAVLPAPRYLAREPAVESSGFGYLGDSFQNTAGYATLWPKHRDLQGIALRTHPVSFRLDPSETARRCKGIARNGDLSSWRRDARTTHPRFCAVDVLPVTLDRGG